MTYKQCLGAEAEALRFIKILPLVGEPSEAFARLTSFRRLSLRGSLRPVAPSSFPAACTHYAPSRSAGALLHYSLPFSDALKVVLALTLTALTHVPFPAHRM
jgi:hypothetical protein